MCRKMVKLVRLLQHLALLPEPTSPLPILIVWSDVFFSWCKQVWFSLLSSFCIDLYLHLNCTHCTTCEHNVQSSNQTVTELVF